MHEMIIGNMIFIDLETRYMRIDINFLHCTRFTLINEKSLVIVSFTYKWVFGRSFRQRDRSTDRRKERQSSGILYERRYPNISSGTKKAKGIESIDWDTLASGTTPCQVSEGQDESPPGLVLLGTTDWQMTTTGGQFTWSLTTFIGLLNQRLRYFDGPTSIRRLWSVMQRWRNAEIQTAFYMCLF